MTLSHKPGTRKALKMMDLVKKIIENRMNEDDERTGCELQKLLLKHGITICTSRALKWRQLQSTRQW